MRVIAFFSFVEFESRRAYADAERAVRTHLDHDQFESARKTLAVFSKSFLFSTKKSTAADLLVEVDRLELRKRQEEVERNKNLRNELITTVTRGRKLVSNGKRSQARTVLRAVLEKTESLELTLEQEKLR